MNRYLIVCDEAGNWYVRSVITVIHDLEFDEKIYRCDEHLYGPTTLKKAYKFIQEKLIEDKSD